VHTANFAYVILPSTLSKFGLIDVTIYYHGDGHVTAGAAIGSGFSTGTSTRWGSQATWSLSQPYSAYEWFPCKQALQDKIDSVFVNVTTSSDNKVGSNGVLKNVISLPNNKVRYEWQSVYPTDYYLISVAVSNYVAYNTYAKLDGDSMLIQNYVYNNPQTLITFKPFFDQTADMITAFSGMFGKYPFWKEKYGHAMAPFSGGMEHQTMTSIGVIDFSIVAHELGHQWFGDHVTCQTWADIWLNEGFATYCEYLALEALNPSNAPLEMNQVHATVMQQPGGSIAFTDTTNVNRIFDSRLTYNKGGAFVHTLRFEMNNDSLFFALLKKYQQQFAFATASTNDFKLLLEQFTKRDFTQVFNQWFYGQGYPTFNVKWNQFNDTLFIQSTQTVSSSTPLFITPLEFKITTTSGDSVIRVQHTQLTNTYVVPLKKSATKLAVDPNNWILNGATVTKDPSWTGLFQSQLLTTLSAYPNPVANTLYLENIPLETTVTIYNQVGQLVLEVINAQRGIDVSNLPAGLYVVKNQSSTLKIIKQ
jgi:aminopeptidase N